MSTQQTFDFTIGDYKVGRTLGQGTFGKVKLAVHIPTSQQVAVKTLQKQKISDQADIQRITRQICILKLLHHPNISQLYQIIQTKTDIHLIMEYASGGELFDHIVKHRRIQQKEAVKIMQQLLAGIQYIHKNGVVHRDLKPQNLLFDQEGNIKIVDFGLSNQYGVGDLLKTACGSPCYAAPEMIAGKKYNCLAVDIWSSGVILYAMLCGYLPFQDPNTSKLYKKIIAGEFQLPKHLSSASKNILTKILNTNPESRYTIQQIRSSQWYNQTSKRYVAKGTIVGEYPLEVNESVLTVMESRRFDPNLVRNYVLSNRHNSLTAYYYLLKKSIDKDPTIIKKINLISHTKRSESPLIYRPNTRINQPLFINPPRNKSQSRNQTRDESFNASSIINSLVQANKQKLIQHHPVIRRVNNFEMREQFKAFPKIIIHHGHRSSPQPTNTNSHNNSFNEELLHSRRHQYQASSHINHSFSPNNDKPVRFTQNVLVPSTIQKIHFTTTPKNNISPPLPSKQQPTNQTAQKILNSSRLEQMNRRKQELSEQLKQISVKIDNSINELKKRNHSMSNSSTMTTPKPEQKNHHKVRFRTQVSTPKTVQIQYQTREHSNYSQNAPRLFINEKEVMIDSPAKAASVNIRSQESRIIQIPRLHLGPFNSQCLFHSQPQTILSKIQNYLRKQAISFCKIDIFTLMISDIQLSIESLQGVDGFHLVDFSLPHQNNEKIIDFLHR